MRIVKSLISILFFISVLVIFIGFTSCESNDADLDRHLIYSSIILPITHTPPPSPNWEKNGPKWNRYLDSFSKAPVKFGILNESFEIKHKIRTNLLNKNELIPKLNESKSVEILNPDNLVLKDNYSSILLKEVSFSEIEKENLDFAVSFSEVVFSKEKNKALVVCRVNYSPMNNYTRLIYLKKINDDWEIIDKKTLAFS